MFEWWYNEVGDLLGSLERGDLGIGLRKVKWGLGKLVESILGVEKM